MTDTNQVPFPHILETPKNSNQNIFRFVTDQNIKRGETVNEKNRRQNNPYKDLPENVYNIFIINEVIEKRKAKGVWDNWPHHPTYYKTIAAYLGCQFESNLGTDLFIKS